MILIFAGHRQGTILRKYFAQNFKILSGAPMAVSKNRHIDKRANFFALFDPTFFSVPIVLQRWDVICVDNREFCESTLIENSKKSSGALMAEGQSTPPGQKLNMGFGFQFNFFASNVANNAALTL